MGYPTALFEWSYSLVVVVELRLVTDRWTDGRTHDNSKYRASVASRGKKWRISVQYILRQLVSKKPLKQKLKESNNIDKTQTIRYSDADRANTKFYY